MDNHARASWEAYRKTELRGLTPLLRARGYELDEEQPHTIGERYLMQAVTTASGRKLILFGTDSGTGKRVVVKGTSDARGAHELRHERRCREVLNALPFAYDSFLFPEEVAFFEEKGYTVSVQAYVPSECTFLERSLEEQFSLALASFKAQEHAHASTYAHLRLIRRTFGSMDASGYLNCMRRFKEGVTEHVPGAEDVLEKTERFFMGHLTTVEQYGGFLTHTDFVPHNLRVANGKVYLLDHSSLRFGNKYEGWARFINFMTLYNPPLAEALVAYVRDNRTPEESLSLKLMRVYRLTEILWYYTRTLGQSEGDLQELNRARISWWQHVLASVLEDRFPDSTVRDSYMRLRDRLRSPDEKRRQEGLH